MAKNSAKFCNAGKTECKWFCGIEGSVGGSCHTMTYRKGYEHTYEFEQCPFPSKIEPPEKRAGLLPKGDSDAS